ncbi:PIG-L family deacetylase [Vallicoccus soli]|uniref:PIG-L family deacetylase n=1 Tax=Vallicoccus soli TaxID=2339232 RepID=A0A3A3YML3_9ACTN|nr:PIG-L family deacetylase [Vallicoccus soli]
MPEGTAVDGAAPLERVLVVTAHPDDVDFGAAGTVARLVAEGVEVTYCVCTDGDAGGFDRSVDRADVPALRRAEQTAAARAVGVADVRFLGYRDGALEVTQDLRRDISRVVRQVRPQRVITQSPERNWERLPASHPDHLAAGEAATIAVYPDARNAFAHPGLLRDEGLEPWEVRELWLMGSPVSTRAVDVTDHAGTKYAALRAHASQTAHLDVEGFVGDWMRRTAAEAGLPPGRLAEAFRATTIP